MLRRKGLRRREPLRPEGMLSWVAPLFPFGRAPTFSVARYFGRQRHKDLSVDGNGRVSPPRP